MKRRILNKVLSILILSFFGLNTVLPPSYAQVVSQTFYNLPAAGTMIAPTSAFAPVVIRGLMIYPDNPLKFDFVLDRGDEKLSDEEFKDESTRLVKYFLASLTVPEKDMWVNLSPYEKNRIVPDNFGQTEMGRDLLAQDYLLKQLTASLMYPENETGKEFWNRVYAKINERFGATDIPLNTFNKVWIVPERASIYEHQKGAFIVKSRLKVMLEEDYVVMANSSFQGQEIVPKFEKKDDKSLSASIQSQVVKEIIIPEIEREVNEGKTFTQLRQIYYSMILASWYKKALKESLLGKVYVDQNKTQGVDIEDKNENQKIYEKYLDAFKAGAYDYIKEDYNPQTQELVTRKYISGGVALNLKDNAMTVTPGLDEEGNREVNAVAQTGAVLTYAMEGGGGVGSPVSDIQRTKEQILGVFRDEKITTYPILVYANGVVVNFLTEAERNASKEEMYVVILTIEDSPTGQYSLRFDAAAKRAYPAEVLDMLASIVNELNRERSDFKLDDIATRAKLKAQIKAKREALLVAQTTGSLLDRFRAGPNLILNGRVMFDNADEIKNIVRETLSSNELNPINGYFSVNWYVDDKGKVVPYVSTDSEAYRSIDLSNKFIFNLKVSEKGDEVILTEIGGPGVTSLPETMRNLDDAVTRANAELKESKKRTELTGAQGNTGAEDRAILGRQENRLANERFNRSHLRYTPEKERAAFQAIEIFKDDREIYETMHSRIFQLGREAKSLSLIRRYRAVRELSYFANNIFRAVAVNLLRTQNELAESSAVEVEPGFIRTRYVEAVLAKEKWRKAENAVEQKFKLTPISSRQAQSEMQRQLRILAQKDLTIYLDHYEDVKLTELHTMETLDQKIDILMKDIDTAIDTVQPSDQSVFKAVKAELAVIKNKMRDVLMLNRMKREFMKNQKRWESFTSLDAAKEFGFTSTVEANLFLYYLTDRGVQMREEDLLIPSNKKWEFKIYSKVTRIRSTSGDRAMLSQLEGGFKDSVGEFLAAVDPDRQRFVSLSDLTNKVNEKSKVKVNSTSVKEIAQRILSGELDVTQEGFGVVSITESGIWFIRKNVGGIDFNPENLMMNIKKNGQGVQFMPVTEESIKNLDIKGFVPVIINVTPATNLPMLLGIVNEENKDKGVLAQAS